MNPTVASNGPVIDPDDIGTNTTTNPSFDNVVAARLSRRNLFRQCHDAVGLWWWGR